MRAKIVPNVKRETLQTQIMQEVEFGTALYTDDAVAYNELHHLFVHGVVDKTQSYVMGRVNYCPYARKTMCDIKRMKYTTFILQAREQLRWVDSQFATANSEERSALESARKELLTLIRSAEAQENTAGEATT